jgi:UDP-N-acetylglucosamine:LPS N-acetylglucosamine transferase
MSSKILFFSRGRGYGHAVPDMAIADELRKLDSGLEINFASYATGAEVFRKSGLPVLDLGLPENNGFVPTLCACHRVITDEKPAVIVAHEEFAALAAAKLAGVPAIFVSAWLPRSGTPQAEALACAAAIIVIENPGIFPVPVGVYVRPHYTGPILRKLKFGLGDRARVRGELQLAEHSFCLVVVPGGSSSEEQFPIADTVLSAFMRLKSADKRLFWVSAKDHELLSKRMTGIQGIELIKYCDPIERLLVAADVVVTKGTRGITLDASAVGVPTISLSPGQNPVDDVLVPRMRSNIALNAKAVDGEVLLHYLELLALTPRATPPPPASQAALTKTAALLFQEIGRLKP